MDKTIQNSACSMRLCKFFFIWNFCSQLGHIKDVQNAINTHDFVNKVLPHIARRSDSICREVLAFLSIMLFNANREVQVREEVTNDLHLLFLIVKWFIIQNLCFYRDLCWTISFPQEKKYSLWQSEKECKFPPTLSKKSKNIKKIIPVLFP